MVSAPCLTDEAGRSSLTHIKSAHKGNSVVYKAQLLVMGPEQDDVIARAVQTLEGIRSQLGDAEGIHGEPREPSDKVVFDVMTAGIVIRVTEDLDIGVKSLQMVLCVLFRGRVS